MLPKARFLYPADRKAEQKTDAWFLPITAHYYTGKVLKLSPHGHIAIQVGPYYLSYGVSKSERSTAIYINNQQQAIRDDRDTYGGDHITIPLPRPSTNIRTCILAWQDAWKPVDYNVFTKNCAHSTLSVAATLGILTDEIITEGIKQKIVDKDIRTLLKESMLRPHTVAENLCKLNLINLVLERKKILQEEKTSPKIKIEQLIANDIERLRFEIIKEKASHLAIDIEKKQEKILKLIDLKNKLPTLSFDELNKELTTLHNTIGHRTAENINQCRYLLTLLTPEQKNQTINDYKKHQEEKVEHLQHTLPCLIAYEKIKSIFNSLPKLYPYINLHRTLYGEHKNNIQLALSKKDPTKIYDRTLYAVNKISQIYHLDFDPKKIGLSEIGELDSLKKNLDVCKKQLEQKIIQYINHQLNIIDLTMSLYEINATASTHILHATHLERLPDSKSLPASEKPTSNIESGKFAMSSHLEWLHYQLNTCAFWYAHAGKTTQKKIINDILIAIHAKKSEYLEKSPNEIFSDIQHHLLEEIWHQKSDSEATIQNANPNDHHFMRDLGQLFKKIKKMLPDRLVVLTNTSISYNFPILDKDYCKDEKNTRAILIQIHKKIEEFPTTRVGMHFRNAMRHLNHFINTGIYHFNDALQEIVNEINHAIFLEKNPDERLLLSNLLTPLQSPLVKPNTSSEIELTDVSLFKGSLFTNQKPCLQEKSDTPLLKPTIPSPSIKR